jgi:hypothetical protein
MAGVVGQRVGDMCGDGGIEEEGDGRSTGEFAAEIGRMSGEVDAVDAVDADDVGPGVIVDGVDAYDNADGVNAKLETDFFIGVVGPSCGDELGVGGAESPEARRRRDAASSGNFTRSECCKGHASPEGQDPAVAKRLQ